MKGTPAWEMAPCNTSMPSLRVAGLQFAITFWEISMLVQKQRLEMRIDMEVWRKKLLKNGLQEIPLDGAIAIRAGILRDFHGDPADRLIVATALQFSATLTTADEKILNWKNLNLKQDARI
jgi:PIN domain nuclease of toxin-antitoxin system